jgi:hypothetical protein
MQTLKAFAEVGYTLAAVALPLVWVAIFISATRESRRLARQCRAAQRGASVASWGLVTLLYGAGQSATLAFQVIAVLLFILNVGFLTVPYGTSHGWW